MLCYDKSSCVEKQYLLLMGRWEWHSGLEDGHKVVRFIIATIEQNLINSDCSDADLE